MKKIYIKSGTLEDFYYQNPAAILTQQLDCPVKDCNGRISANFGQKIALCDKCKKAIVFQEKSI